MRLTMLLDILWHSLSTSPTHAPFGRKKPLFTSNMHARRKEEPGSETNDLWWIYGIFSLSVVRNTRGWIYFMSKYIHELIKKLFLNASHNYQQNMHNSNSFDNELIYFKLKFENDDDYGMLDEGAQLLTKGWKLS